MEEADEAKETRLSTPAQAEACTERDRKRMRRTTLAPSVNRQPGEHPEATPERPTAVELAAAGTIIAAMRDTRNPALGLEGGRENPRVVAYALAIYFSETFESDKEAKRRFGIGPSANIRGLWTSLTWQGAKGRVLGA